MKKYLAFTNLSIQEYLRNKGAFIGSLLLYILVILIFWQLWKVISQEHHAAHNLADYVWYIVFTQAMLIVGPKFYHQIDEDVRTGNFSYFLNRPISYISMRFFEGLGQMIVYFPPFILTGSIIAFFLTHKMPEIYILISTFVVSFFGIMLYFIFSLPVCLMAFWFQQGRPFFWVYNKFVFLLGGLFIPLTVFPVFVQRIAFMTPFAYMLYKPSSLIYDFSWHNFFQTLLMIVFWIALGAMLIFGLYRMGVKKVEIYGG